jgi:PKD repeat protein
MKKLVILFFAAALYSCDDRFDAFLSTSNTAPEIYFNDNRSLKELSDSLKISLKHTIEPIAFTLNFADRESQISSVSYTFEAGVGKIINSAGDDLGGAIAADNQAQQLRFVGLEAGNVKVRFDVRDAFNVTTSATLNVLVFVNLAPVANLTTNRIQVNSPFEYEFDASSSFDPDRSQGGGIEVYEYTIDNTFTFRTKLNRIRYVFDRSGGHEIRLSVYDNDGTRSPVITRNITIQ